MKTQAIPSLDELLRKDRDAHDDQLSQQVPSLAGAAAPNPVISEPTEALNYNDLIKAHPDFAKLAELDGQEEEATKLLDISEMSALPSPDAPVSVVSIPGEGQPEEPTKLLDLDQMGDLDALLAPPPAVSPAATLQEGEGASTVDGLLPGNDRQNPEPWNMSNTPLETAAPALEEMGAAPLGPMPTPPVAGDKASSPKASKDNTKTILIVVGVVLAFLMLSCFCIGGFYTFGVLGM